MGCPRLGPLPLSHSPSSPSAVVPSLIYEFPGPSTCHGLILQGCLLQLQQQHISSQQEKVAGFHRAGGGPVVETDLAN